MKRLTKSSENRYICGVCSGLAKYFGIDATIFRLIFVVLTLFGGSGILLYLLAVLIMPNDDSTK